jgi:hypothetical protein
MKKLLLGIVLFLASANTCKSQVFDVVDSFRLGSGQFMIFLNEDSIYHCNGSALLLLDKFRNIKWFDNTTTGTECLHINNKAVSIDRTHDDGLVSLVNINESCTWRRARVFKSNGYGVGTRWHYDFAPDQIVKSGGVFLINDTINVFASLGSSILPQGMSGFVKYRFDTLGNVIDSVVNLVDYSIYHVKRYTEDSLIFVLSDVNHSFAVADFNFDTIRVIRELPGVSGINSYRIQNDSIYFNYSSSVDYYSDGITDKDGIGVVSINGQGLVTRTTNDSLEGFIRYHNIIKIDSFYIVPGYSSQTWSSINVFDENLNFRMRMYIDYFYMTASQPKHLFLVDDSTLLFTMTSGHSVYLRWDWSQMPPLPEDTIPVDTTKISVPELLKKTQTSLFPNPTTTHFTLQSTQIINRIQVFDLRGALVLEQNVQSTEHQVQLSEAGTYIIHIHLQDGSTERQKVVKMRE